MIYTIKCSRCGNEVEAYRNPFPTVDIAVTREGKILLIKRKNPPAGWALPGGFVDYGESAETAALRELKEETGLEGSDMKLFGVYSEPGRDPRFHTLSVVYLANATGKAEAGDDAGRAEWFEFSNLPEQIAFDHRQIIESIHKKELGHA